MVNKMFRDLETKQLVLIIALISLLQGWSITAVSDIEFVTKYDEVINQVACEAVAQKQGTEMKVNLSRYANIEEITKLTFWNIGNNLAKTKLDFGEDLNWKRELVDSLFQIFTDSCPNNTVPHGYMNIFRELAMIYLNSAEPRNVEEPRTEAWKTMQKILDHCEEGLKPYTFVFKAMQVDGLQGKVENVVETAQIFPPVEKVDMIFESEIDLVVDNLWWVFSHAMGRCYPKIPMQAIVAPKLKAIFVVDILKPLMNRWGNPGPLQDFAPVVGNYDMKRAQRNMRYCVTSSYFLNGIIELQLVRPLRVGYYDESANSNRVQNRKTGDTF